ncbi:MAG: RDD family protein [Ruminococcaceae bacterium]|nr:RDD family protein [Oscillospiraceae bacterium]
MISDLQKASLLKRASAFLLDIILLAVLVTGLAFLISTVTGYDNYVQQMNDLEKEYEEKFNVSFDLTEQEYNELSQQEKTKIDEVYAAYAADERVVYAYNMMVNLILLTTSLSILGAYLVLELILPLVFGNGQTVGKKIFAIGLMQTNGVRVSAFSMFVRTVLGKCTIGTLVPAAIIILSMLGSAGITGPIILLLILVLQIGLIVGTKTNSAIHDVLAYTVAVDLASQMIFDSPEQMLEYKKKIHAEAADRAQY